MYSRRDSTQIEDDTIHEKGRCVHKIEDAAQGVLYTQHSARTFQRACFTKNGGRCSTGILGRTGHTTEDTVYVIGRVAHKIEYTAFPMLSVLTLPAHFAEVKNILHVRAAALPTSNCVAVDPHKVKGELAACYHLHPSARESVLSARCLAWGALLICHWPLGGIGVASGWHSLE